MADDVARIAWPCPAGAEVVLYRIDGSGHTWPGSEFSASIEAAFGPTTFSISANELMWSFFEANLCRPREGAQRAVRRRAGPTLRSADVSNDPAEIVRQFCAVFETGDLDAILAFLDDEAVYHNIPLDPVQGHEAIRTTLEGFTAGVERLEFEVRALAVDGDVVLTERVDRFVLADRTVELPVMGAFEVTGGRISAWRDYFDLNQFMSQLGA